MAALMESVEIRTAEYRPCYVAVVEYCSGGKTIRKDERKALFHRWANTFDLREVKWGMSMMHGYITTAIVEYEDGTIAEVVPTAVRFVPGIMNQYNFGPEEG